MRKMESAAGLSLSSFLKKLHLPPPKTYAFTKQKSGSKGEEGSCRAAWFDKHDWLHYNTTADSAFCHLCMSAEFDKRSRQAQRETLLSSAKGLLHTGRMV